MISRKKILNLQPSNWFHVQLIIPMCLQKRAIAGPPFNPRSQWPFPRMPMASKASRTRIPWISKLTKIRNGHQGGITSWKACRIRTSNGSQSWTHWWSCFSCREWWQWFYYGLCTKILQDIIKSIVVRMRKKNSVGSWFTETFSGLHEKEWYWQCFWDLAPKFFAWLELLW